MPFIACNEDGPLHVEEILTRETFEELCRPLLERLAAPVQKALKELPGFNLMMIYNDTYNI